MTDNHPDASTPIEAELVGDDDLELLTVDDVAQLFHVPRKWVYAKAGSGELPSVKIGVYRRFRRRDLRAFLDNPATDVAEPMTDLVRRPRRR